MTEESVIVKGFSPQVAFSDTLYVMTINRKQATEISITSFSAVWQTDETLVFKTVCQPGSPHHHLISPNNGQDLHSPHVTRPGDEVRPWTQKLMPVLTFPKIV
jgi:hypothetical protein